ncbi:MAG: L,D-transpeptidase family protein [Candidatus Andersenbacteria bacterium]
MQTKRSWRVGWLYVGAALSVLLAGLLVFGAVANGRVLPNTTLSNANLGLLQQHEAQQRAESILTEYEARPITLLFDGEVTQHTFKELGLSIDHGRTLAGLEERTFTFVGGNPFGAAVASLQPHAVRAVVTIDRVVADEAIARLTTQTRTPPQDARIIIRGGTVTIQGEVPGFGFDYSLIQAQLVNYVAEFRTDPLAFQENALAPSVTAAMLGPVRAQVAELLAAPITINAGSKHVTLKPAEVGTWLVVNANQIAANGAGIDASVKHIASKVDQPAAATVYVAGTDYVISKGHDGTVLDQTAARRALASLIVAAMPTTSIDVPVTTQPSPRKEIGSAAAPYTSTGKEIVVVLSEQRLYAWDDGVLVRSFLISSGSTYPTYPGTFHVYNKIKDHTMAGPGYNLPHVPDSMYFDGERALHGAYWHNNFGHPMSHGCINEPLDQAAWLYDWTPVGTTVHVVE